MSSGLVRLNAATRQWHSAVDDSWLDLLRPTVTVTDYLAQLVRTYGLIAPFESACKYTTGLSRHIDMRRLVRAGLIAQDLLELDLTPSQVASVPTCPAITMFQTTGEALGWLYVIERTTLLADGLGRHVRHALPQISSATKYLEAFSTADVGYWQSFAQVVDEATELSDEIESSAATAFEATHSWFRTSAEARRTA